MSIRLTAENKDTILHQLKAHFEEHTCTFLVCDGHHDDTRNYRETVKTVYADEERNQLVLRSEGSAWGIDYETAMLLFTEKSVAVLHYWDETDWLCWLIYHP